jgi:hypothetical protein
MALSVYRMLLLLGVFRSVPTAVVLRSKEIEGVFLGIGGTPALVDHPRGNVRMRDQTASYELGEQPIRARCSGS